jgi:hypothetical protein
MDLSLGAVDRFLGAPLTNTHWPGMVNQMLLVPTIIVDAALHAHLGGGLSGTLTHFNRYLANVYRDPWRTLYLGRLIVVALFSIGATALTYATARRTRSPIVATLLAALVCTSPELWFASQCAMANGAAFGLLACAGAIVFLSTGEGHARTETLEAREALIAIATATLCGLALATRNTMAPFVLFVFLVLVIETRGPRLRVAMIFLAAVAVATLLACPAVWIEPIRWVKATAGNYRKHGAPRGIVGASREMFGILPWWLVASSVAAAAYGLRAAATRRFVAAALACIATMVVLASRSPSVEGRYFHSVLLILWLMLARVVEALVAAPATLDLADARRRTLVAALALGSALALITNTTEWVRTFRALEAHSQVLTAAANEVSRDHGKRVAVPLSWLDHTLVLSSSRGVTEILDALQPRILSGETVAQYLATYGIDRGVAAAMALNFNEKELSFAARLRCIAAGGSFGDVDLVYYALPTVATRFSVESTERLSMLLANGELDAVYVAEGDGYRRYEGRDAAARMHPVTSE